MRRDVFEPGVGLAWKAAVLAALLVGGIAAGISCVLPDQLLLRGERSLDAEGVDVARLLGSYYASFSARRTMAMAIADGVQDHKKMILALIADRDLWRRAAGSEERGEERRQRWRREFNAKVFGPPQPIGGFAAGTTAEEIAAWREQFANDERELGESGFRMDDIVVIYKAKFDRAERDLQALRSLQTARADAVVGNILASWVVPSGTEERFLASGGGTEIAADGPPRPLEMEIWDSAVTLDLAVRDGSVTTDGVARPVREYEHVVRDAAGGEIARAQVMIDAAPLRRRIEAMRHWMQVSAGILAGAVALLVLLVSRFALRPVARLTGEVVEMREEEVAAPATSYRGVIGRLAAELRPMAEAVDVDLLPMPVVRPPRAVDRSIFRRAQGACGRRRRALAALWLLTAVAGLAVVRLQERLAPYAAARHAGGMDGDSLVASFLNDAFPSVGDRPGETVVDEKADERETFLATARSGIDAMTVVEAIEAFGPPDDRRRYVRFGVVIEELSYPHATLVFRGPAGAGLLREVEEVAAAETGPGSGTDEEGDGGRRGARGKRP